jgi:hypothetical protein
MTQMPGHMRDALQHLVEIIEAYRDRALAESIASDDSHEQSNWRGRWAGHAITLSAIHKLTDGEFGTPYDDQLSPFTADERPQGGGVR